MNLTDKNGIKINHDDVIYNGVHYFRIYDREDGEVEAISCTYGYMHNIKQSDLSDFECVGTYEGNENLFNCD